MARKVLLLLFASGLVVTTTYGVIHAAPGQAQPGFLGVRFLSNTGIVVAVYEGSPAERAGIRTADFLKDVDGKPVTDKGSVAGAVEKITVLRKGEDPFSVELQRVARTEIRWGSGVLYAEKEKVWRALIVALAGPSLSQIFRVRQALKDEGVIFCDKAGPIGFTGNELVQGDIVFPERLIQDSNQLAYAIWVTPTLRVREKSGATIVDVTLIIDYRGLYTISSWSGTAKSAGGIEGSVFDLTFSELNR